MTKRIVLAYSGALDGSVAIPWLAEQHGAEVLRIRQGDGSEPPAADGQQLALLDEVRREEDGQEDLGELPGLEVDRSDADPDPGPSLGVADSNWVKLMGSMCSVVCF